VQPRNEDGREETVKKLGAVVFLAGFWLGVLLPATAKDKEEEKIEAVVEAVIKAYEQGDYTTMGRYYAPTVTVVAGDFNPPVEGWSTVAERYRTQHSNLTAVTLARENTRVARQGKIAWVVYQWRFAALLAGNPIAALGHTTLVMQKQGGQWLIVHNHSSALPAPPEPAPTGSPAQPQPSQSR
jgi:uncharacterized protein (TIGR02246 family)